MRLRGRCEHKDADKEGEIGEKQGVEVRRKGEVGGYDGEWLKQNTRQGKTDRRTQNTRRREDEPEREREEADK